MITTLVSNWRKGIVVVASPSNCLFYSKQSLIHFGSFLASLWTCCFSKTSIMLCSSLGTLVWLSFFELSLLVGVDCSNCNCCDHEKRNQKSRKMPQYNSWCLFSWSVDVFIINIYYSKLCFWNKNIFYVTLSKGA